MPIEFYPEPVKGVNASSLYVESLFIRKAFQEFSYCRASIRYFGGDAETVEAFVGKQFVIRWQEDNDKEWLMLFQGQFASGYFQEQADHIHCELEGYSLGLFKCGSDLIFHSYQHPDQTLLNILDTMHKKRPSSFNFVHTDKNKIGSLPHAIGMQLGETDFDYTRCLLATYGCPIVWDDEDDKLIIGCQRSKEDRPLPYCPQNDPYFRMGKKSIRYAPGPKDVFTPPYRTEWQQSLKHDKLLSEYEKERYPKQQQNELIKLKFQTVNSTFLPGDLISEKPFSWRVICVEYKYDASGSLFTSVTCAVTNETGEWRPPFTPPAQGFGRLLGKVSRTNGDPHNLGRVQVQFPISKNKGEKTDGWFPVLTPYEGFCFLPEPGNRVVLECLDPFQGIWAVAGVLRTNDYPVKENQALISKGRIVLKAVKNIEVKANKEVKIISDGKMEVKAGGKLKVKSKKNLDLKGDEIHLN